MNNIYKFFLYIYIKKFKKNYIYNILYKKIFIYISIY